MITFCYHTGEEVREGDRVFTGFKKFGQVLLVLQPGTRQAADYSCEDTGGVLIQEDWEGTPSFVLENPPDGDQWEDLDFLGRGSVS